MSNVTPRTPPLAPPLLGLCLLAGAALSCGPVPRRDLLAIPQRQVTYDDLCGLQSFFDAREHARIPAPRVLSEQATETEQVEPDENGRMRRAELGEGVYLITHRTDRERLERLLREEYRRLDPVRLSAPEQQVRVTLRWWRSGTLRRVRPDEDIVIESEGRRVELPAHPCVGELVLGAEGYRVRRRVLTAEAARARGETPAPEPDPDAGVTDAGVTDAGAPAGDVSVAAEQ